MSRPRRKPATVHAIPGAGRAVDALKRVNVALANESPKGIIVITVAQDGETDTRVYGDWKRIEIAWAGGQLWREGHEP